MGARVGAMRAITRPHAWAKSQANASLQSLILVRRTSPKGFVRRAGSRSPGGYLATSLGGTPMTFTPAPRAMSIAKITSWYSASFAPFTKMILSGRGS